MPKRKIAGITSSPPQPSLAKFLPTRKQAPVQLVKRTKLKEAGSPVKEIVEVSCASSSCWSTSEISEIITVLEFIDEVILFAGKPLLWGHIQEEIYSLHKRYT